MASCTNVLTCFDSNGTPEPGECCDAIIVHSNPNGVITAEPGRFAIDPVNHVLYVKETGNGNMGWLQYV